MPPVLVIDTNSTTGVFKFVLAVLTLITCVPYHACENVALPVNCPKKVVPLNNIHYSTTVTVGRLKTNFTTSELALFIVAGDMDALYESSPLDVSTILRVVVPCVTFTLFLCSTVVDILIWFGVPVRLINNSKC